MSLRCASYFFGPGVARLFRTICLEFWNFIPRNVTKAFSRYPPSTFDLAIAVAQTDASNRFLYPTEDEMFTSITRMSTSFRIGLLAVISLIAAIPAYPQQTGTSQAAS